MTTPINSSLSSATDAQEYFQKYHLDVHPSVVSMARGSTLARMANTDFTKTNTSFEDMIRDYHALPSAADKYAVFVRLQKGGDNELLRTIVGISDESGLDYRSSLYGMFQANMALLSIRSETDLWARRLIILQALFKIQDWMQFNGALMVIDPEGKAIPAENVLGDQFQASEWLKTLYVQSLPDPDHLSLNPLFDTDGDFDWRHKENWEWAFDDKDVLPFDAIVQKDSDGDRVADEFDSAPQDASQWSNLEIGETKTVQIERLGHTISVHVHRIEVDQFAVRVDLTVSVSDRAIDKDYVQDNFLTDEFLAQLKARIEAAFHKAYKSDRVQFSYEVHIMLSHNIAAADIEFTDRSIRDHSRLWSVDTLKQEPTSETGLHEAWHHFGLLASDLYHEPWAYSYEKDLTTRPGQSLLSSEHVRAASQAGETQRISEVDLMHITNWDVFLNSPKASVYRAENSAMLLANTSSDTSGFQFVDAMHDPLSLAKTLFENANLNNASVRYALHEEAKKALMFYDYKTDTFPGVSLAYEIYSELISYDPLNLEYLSQLMVCLILLEKDEELLETLAYLDEVYPRIARDEDGELMAVDQFAKTQLARFQNLYDPRQDSMQWVVFREKFWNFVERQAQMDHLATLLDTKVADQLCLQMQPQRERRRSAITEALIEIVGSDYLYVPPIKTASRRDMYYLVCQSSEKLMKTNHDCDAWRSPNHKQPIKHKAVAWMAYWQKEEVLEVLIDHYLFADEDLSLECFKAIKKYPRSMALHALEGQRDQVQNKALLRCEEALSSLRSIDDPSHLK